MVIGVPRPGELDCVDPTFIRAHAPRLRRLLHRYFRARIHGFHRLPSGPFVAVGNHSGAELIPDALVWLAAYHASGRQPTLVTLAHDQMFDAYPAALARWVARMGAIRAEPEVAREALERGHALQLYPGGDHDACRPFSRRHQIEFAGRTGYVDLARDAGVPIVPVVAIGGHETLVILRQGRRIARGLGLHERLRLDAWPLSLALPWGLWLGPLPGYLPLPSAIEIAVLDPIEARGSTSRIDRAVRETLQAALDRLARDRIPVLGRPHHADAP